MYEAFYGLREKPFNLTPDPKFLFLSEKHKEAFAHLLYGIKNRSGFVMLSGEIGTGKTTICRNLLNNLDTHTEVAFIFNPPLNPLELLKRINGEFGIDNSADTVLELTDRLNQHLLEAAAAGRSCVLIIDEAQNLAPTVLEQIRLLSNLETATEKLLQIILIGQPELADKLALHELRQLNQRITARYHLKELDQRETQQYIGYRLHVAGGRRRVQFDKAAAKIIFKKSGGTPRVINALSDRCLLIGYTNETHTITAGIARQAVREIRGAEKRSRRRAKRSGRGWSPMALASAAALLILLGAAAALFVRPIEQLAQEIGNFNAIIAGETPVPSEKPGNPVTMTPTVEARATAPEASATPPREAIATVAEQLRERAPVATRVVERLAPAPAAPTAEERLEAVFTGVSAAETRRAALAALLASWDRPLSGAYPDDDNAAALAGFVEGHGLAHERLTPALDQLLAINLPALVRMRDQDDERWLALTAVAEDGALTVTSGMGDTLVVPRDVFLSRFAGEAIVPWRDPSPGTSLLLSGKQGRQVTGFKQKLRSIGRLAASNTSDVYDSATASAVSRLQAETGLVVDGMAGKQVRMVLSSWLPEVDTPSIGPSPVIVRRVTVPSPAAETTGSAAPVVEGPVVGNALPEASSPAVSETASSEVPATEVAAVPAEAESSSTAVDVEATVLEKEPRPEASPEAEDGSVEATSDSDAPEAVVRGEVKDSATPEEAEAAAEEESVEGAAPETVEPEVPVAPVEAAVGDGAEEGAEAAPLVEENPEAAPEAPLVSVSELSEPARMPEGEDVAGGGGAVVTDPVPGSAPLVPRNY